MKDKLMKKFKILNSPKNDEEACVSCRGYISRGRNSRNFQKMIKM